MKKLLLASTMLAFLGVNAEAADMNVYKAPPAAPAPSNSWTGFYLGVNGGGASGSFDFTNSVPGSAQFHQSASGWFGGGQVGYNYQAGYFVFGGEVDADFSTQKATVGAPAIGAVAVLPAGSTVSQPWFATARLRAGYLVSPSLLLYGTGGGAYGNSTVTTGAATVQLPDVGWAAGGGIEYMLTKNFLLRAEYLRVDLFGPSATIGAVNLKTEVPMNIVRGGVNFKFD